MVTFLYDVILYTAVLIIVYSLSYAFSFAIFTEGRYIHKHSILPPPCCSHHIILASSPIWSYLSCGAMPWLLKPSCSVRSSTTQESLPVSLNSTFLLAEKKIIFLTTLLLLIQSFHTFWLSYKSSFPMWSMLPVCYIILYSILSFYKIYLHFFSFISLPGKWATLLLDDLAAVCFL